MIHHFLAIDLGASSGRAMLGRLDERLTLVLEGLDKFKEPEAPKDARATIAKEKGLEPLADLIFAQDPATDPVAAAMSYVGHEYEIENKKSKIEN